MKLNDLKALYDTVSLKLTKQHGCIVDYNPRLTAVSGCHSNALLLGSSEQKLQLIMFVHVLTKTKHLWENQLMSSM